LHWKIAVRADDFKWAKTGEGLGFEVNGSAAMPGADIGTVTAEVHDRMPVLLTEDQFAPWLSGEAGKECLTPRAEHIFRYPACYPEVESKCYALKNNDFF
jgi:hypothetical protein